MEKNLAKFCTSLAKYHGTFGKLSWYTLPKIILNKELLSKVYVREKQGARNYGNWVTVSNQCVKPLSLWLPYLIIKKNQALVALDFQNNRKTNKTDEDWNNDLESYTQIRKLNARYGTEYYVDGT